MATYNYTSHNIFYLNIFLEEQSEQTSRLLSGNAVSILKHVGNLVRDAVFPRERAHLFANSDARLQIHDGVTPVVWDVDNFSFFLVELY